MNYLTTDRSRSRDEDIQQRLYVINTSGSGEAHFLLLNHDRTEISSYQVKTDHWKVTKDLCSFGIAVLDNYLYVIGGYNKKKASYTDNVFRYYILLTFLQKGGLL